MFVKSNNGSSVSSEEDFREKYLNRIISMVENNEFVREHCIEGSFTRKRTEGENKVSSVFCKLIQYLFDWIKDYVKEKNIKDKNGVIFIVPPFSYSQQEFSNHFPE